MLLQDLHIAAGAGEQKAGHHARRTASGDDQVEFRV